MKKVHLLNSAQWLKHNVRQSITSFMLWQLFDALWGPSQPFEQIPLKEDESHMSRSLHKQYIFVSLGTRPGCSTQFRMLPCPSILIQSLRPGKALAVTVVQCKGEDIRSVATLRLGSFSFHDRG